MVYRHLLAKEGIVSIHDLSNQILRQSRGIDGMVVHEEDSILHAIYFDVKTDFRISETNNFFIETSSSNKTK